MLYNRKKNKCEKIIYSGCSEYGCATEWECEDVSANNLVRMHQRLTNGVLQYEANI